MKRVSILICVIGIGWGSVSTLAQAPNSPPAPANAPASDSTNSTTTPDNGLYLTKPQNLEGCRKLVAQIKGKPCDIIFIGDSITAHWLGVGKDVWNKYYAPRHAFDFGVSSDKTQNVLWRMDNLDIKDLKPKVAVILIGTNNRTDTPRKIADGVKAVIDKTGAFYPGIKIILVSIMPNKRAMQTMMDTNAIIKNDADNTSVYWLDLVPLMPPVGDNWKGLGPDHLHPDASGYQIWADAMEPLLNKLLAASKN
jgi:lysophospholipase L1-like esterase